MRRAQPLMGRVVVIGILSATISSCTSETPPTPQPALDAPATSAPAAPAANTSAGVAALLDKLAVEPPPGGAASLVSQAERPLADSPQIERGRAATPAGVRPLERVEFERVDLAGLFPPPAAQVPKVWIGWYVNRTIDAFRQAIDEDKPLPLVAAEDWCNPCTNLALNALRCAYVDRFAGDAVFAFSFLASDKGATAIAGSLKIDAYPTITVLEPESRILIERGRINGYFDGAALGDHLDTILWKTRPRVLPPGWDGGTDTVPLGSWTPPPGGPATVTNALFGAASRGLTHAPPAPKCG